jgi:uncharacterized protein (DUF2164 family)
MTINFDADEKADLMGRLQHYCAIELNRELDSF